jgi:LPS-assembly lipoprotein|tara:strand:- start:3013 stop:3513 length:501 start_codon:yes stop_codon:yes gene_type:complete
LFKIIAFFTFAFLIAGCGFKPLYGDRTASSVTDELAKIKVLTIKDRLGQKLHNLLLDRLSPKGRPTHPLYTLSVQAVVNKQELGLKFTEVTTRAKLTLQTNFNLDDAATGVTLLKGTARSVNSYNIVDSDFATLSAESNATDRAIREVSDAIKIRLSLFLASNRGT